MTKLKRTWQSIGRNTRMILGITFLGLAMDILPPPYRWMLARFYLDVLNPLMVETEK